MTRRIEKVGLFGGTFNPPHTGHILAFRSFCTHISPDLVCIMPTGIPPHKEIQGTDYPARRFAMARLAFGKLGGDKIFSAMEIARGGKSYTSDTVAALKDCFGCDRIYLYIGSDMLRSFEKWHRFDYLMENCVLVTAPRKPSEREETEAVCRTYAEKYGCVYEILPLVPCDISSTELRAMFDGADDKKNLAENAKKYLTDDLYGYIMKNELYAHPAHDAHSSPAEGEITPQETVEAIRRDVRTKTDGKRLSHILSVEKTALELAALYLPLYGFGPEYRRDVSAAALLHDITKNEDEAWQETYLSHFMRNFSGFPQILHSWSGAYYGLEHYEVNPRVFRAVYHHTTGSADMDIFEKIIFFSDFIEPNRQNELCVSLREKYRTMSFAASGRAELLRGGLDRLILEALDGTLSYLTKNGRGVHPKLFEARDFLRDQAGTQTPAESKRQIPAENDNS